MSKAIGGTHSKDHVIERYLDVARYLGAKVDSLDDVEFPMPDLSTETASVQHKLQEAGWQGGDYVVIVPGARWWTKEWPVEHYIELAKSLRLTVLPWCWQADLMMQSRDRRLPKAQQAHWLST